MAERIRGGRLPLSVANQSARPEATMAMTRLAATNAHACSICALACNALMPM
jgi:hypothetical protein